MTRREAIAALSGLAAMSSVSSVAVAALAPGDVIVVEIDEQLSRNEIERLSAILVSLWPQHKCIVLDSGATLKVVKGGG